MAIILNGIGRDGVTITIDHSKAAAYKIVDGKTGQQVGSTYKSRARARARADKLDMQYGGYRYSVVPA